MEITKQEAQETLAEIDRTILQTRRTIANGCSSPMLILWGTIWVIGYTGIQFFPAKAGLFWGPLDLFGGLASWFIATRATPIKGRADIRFGLFWIILFVYAGIWAFLLAPFNPERIGAYFGTIPMFAYVVGGLWLGRFFTWLGLAVTALIVTGAILFQGWLNLWIAIGGGGSLILSGLYIRKYWR